jgi:hypothetical protein
MESAGICGADPESAYTVWAEPGFRVLKKTTSENETTAPSVIRANFAVFFVNTLIRILQKKKLLRTN